MTDTSTLALKAQPTDRWKDFPQLKLSNLSNEWFQDPVDPDTLLYPDTATGYYRALDLNAISSEGMTEAAVLDHLSDDYGGRRLVCPDDCRLEVVELCADPGAHYGPWRIVDRQNTVKPSAGVVGQSLDYGFSSLQEPMQRLIGQPLPKPVPMPAKHDQPAELKLPFGHMGFVFPIFRCFGGLQEERYEVQVFCPNGKRIGGIQCGEDQSMMIRLRDDDLFFLEHRRKLVGPDIPLPPRNTPHFVFDRLPGRWPADDHPEDGQRRDTIPF